MSSDIEQAERILGELQAKRDALVAHGVELASWKSTAGRVHLIQCAICRIERWVLACLSRWSVAPMPCSMPSTTIRTRSSRRVWS
jgi:hypothetical protein